MGGDMDQSRGGRRWWNGGWMDRRDAEGGEPESHFRDNPAYFSEPGSVSQEIPTVNMEHDRIQSIINNTPAIFEIAENKNADGSEPLIELAAFNPINDGVIYDSMGAKYGVDPDWLKAIAYMENTHGFYDGIPPLNLVNSSYRPMNVQYRTWKPLADQLGLSEFQIQYRVESNVELATLIIKRIMVRVPNPTLEKVASIYNFTGAEVTRDYGARVQKIYEGRLWEK
jgi:hypothetical protein